MGSYPNFNNNAYYSGYNPYPPFPGRAANPYPPWPNSNGTYPAFQTQPQGQQQQQQPFTPFIPPTPSDHGSEHLEPMPPPPVTKSKSHKRTSSTPMNLMKPLKSALKKSKTATAGPSSAHEQIPPVSILQNATPSSSKPKSKRPRAMSQPPAPVAPAIVQTEEAPTSEFKLLNFDQPPHVMMSLVGDDELHFHFLTESAIKEIEERILPLWPTNLNELSDSTWRVRFQDAPWNESKQLHLVIDILVRIFKLMNRRVKWFVLYGRSLQLTTLKGFIVQGAINIGSPVPKIVFVPTQNVKIEYIAVYFAKKNVRAYILYPHPAFNEHLEPMLRKHLGPEFLELKKLDDTISIVHIRVDPSTKRPEMPVHAFAAAIMQTLAEFHLQFEVALPVGRKLGDKDPRREVLLFRNGLTDERIEAPA